MFSEKIETKNSIVSRSNNLQLAYHFCEVSLSPYNIYWNDVKIFPIRSYLYVKIFCLVSGRTSVGEVPFKKKVFQFLVLYEYLELVPYILESLCLIFLYFLFTVNYDCYNRSTVTWKHFYSNIYISLFMKQFYVNYVVKLIWS